MRVRFRFTKLGKVRWTSHRDVARMWERALRRAGLPVAYSGGFSPRPKLSFGLALPTGAESVAEYLDVELSSEADDLVGAADLPARLSPALPVGVDVVGASPAAVGDLALQHEVTACRWELAVGEVPELPEAVARVLAADQLVVTRQRKGQDVTDDIRPAILSLELLSAGGDAAPGTATLACELATQPRGLRPSELLGSLGVAVEDVRVRRTHQWIERDGARREPIPLGATDAPHAVVRAS